MAEVETSHETQILGKDGQVVRVIPAVDAGKNSWNVVPCPKQDGRVARFGTLDEQEEELTASYVEAYKRTLLDQI